MTDYQKIVEAFGRIARGIRGKVPAHRVLDNSEMRAIAQEALPLAREAVAKAEALDYLKEYWGNWLVTILAKDKDCPEIIRKMLEEKK